MAGSGPNDFHVDGLLTNLSIGYKNLDYIADQMFPLVKVNKESDIVPQFLQSDWFRRRSQVVGLGERVRWNGYRVDNTMKYSVVEKGSAVPIYDRVVNNSDTPYVNHEQRAVRNVLDALALERELDFNTDFMTTGVWGTDKDGTTNTDFTQWDDQGGSSPLQNITDFKNAVEGKVGVEPNTLELGKDVLVKLMWHPDLLDTIKYTQTGVMTEDLIRTLFGFDRLLIGRAIYTTTNEGTAEASVTYSRVWGKHGLMLYTTSAPALEEPTAGYTFVCDTYGAGTQVAFRRLRFDPERVTVAEGVISYDQKATAPRAGLFMKACVS